MTKMKKWISAMLTLSITTTLIAPASAAIKDPEMEEITSNIIVFQNDEEASIVVRTEDYDNGDSHIYLVENGETTVSYFVDSSENTITTTDYITNEISIKSVVPAVVETVASPLADSNFSYVGRIGYQYYVQGYVMGERYVDTYMYTERARVVAHDFTAKYRDVAELIATVASVLVISAKIAGGVVDAGLETLGKTADDVSLGIIPLYIWCEATTIDWDCEVPGSTTLGTEFSGTGYTITFNNGAGSYTDYEGSYYTAASYYNHSSAFANKIYTSIWGSSLYDVISWS